MANHRKLLPAVADLAAWCLLFLPALFSRPTGLVDFASTGFLLFQSAVLIPQVAILVLWAGSRARRGSTPLDDAHTGYGADTAGGARRARRFFAVQDASMGPGRFLVRFLLLVPGLFTAAFAGSLVWLLAGQPARSAISFDLFLAAAAGSVTLDASFFLRLAGIASSAALFMLFTALREELFFRVCVIDDLARAGLPRRGALVASALLFSLPHAWEGGNAVIAAFIMALILGAAWARWRSARLIILAHFTYNCCVLAFAALSPGIG